MNPNDAKGRSNDTWRWPIVLGVTSSAGLMSALVADGWADVLAWFGLGLPVIVACAYALRRKPVDADCK